MTGAYKGEPEGRISRGQAIAGRYTIDDFVYPPLAYKGPRFRPTECALTFTPLEQELLSLLDDVVNAGDLFGGIANEANRLANKARYNR